MANLQASGPGHVYDPRISRSRDFWFQLEAAGKVLRQQREAQTAAQQNFYQQMRGRKLTPFNHEP